MPKRRYRHKGGSGEGGSGEGGSGEGQQVISQGLRNMKNAVKTSSTETIAKAIQNPHGTNAFFACFFVFLVPLAIYSFTGKIENIFVHEIMMSMMAMSMAASGISYFLLQDDTQNSYFVKAFLGLSVVSFIAWCYFAWKITSESDDDDDDDKKD